MNIFQIGIKFKNWLEIYIGIENEYIIKNSDVLFFYESGNLPFCTEKEYTDLCYKVGDSSEGFKKQIKLLAENAFNINLTLDPETNYELTITLKEKPYEVWELEYLLGIQKSNKTIKDKIYDVYLLWCDFKHYNVDWSSFLWLNNSIESENQLYKNFNLYVTSLVNKLNVACS